MLLSLYSQDKSLQLFPAMITNDMHMCLSYQSSRQKKIIERNSEALKPLPKDQQDKFTFSVR